MEKLNVENLFPGERDYEQAKRRYIASYERYIPGGFLSLGHYESDPLTGEAKWNNKFPGGFEEWREIEGRVAYSDVKVLGDKINELIDALHYKQSFG